MSGHSKWKNIMHKKEKTDAQKAKVFTKIGKEIAIAVREGGADVNSNGKLRDLVAKAKAQNVPNDNIKRAIEKASSGNAEDYKEVTYEGYGPCGIAVIVTATTDNPNRTTPQVRSYFAKYGGNLGQNGCVSFLFSDRGTILIEDNGKIDADKLMEDALEVGATDFATEDDVFEIVTEPDDLGAVREGLESKGYEIASAEVEKVPSTYVTLEDEADIRHMNLLLETLEDNDDVQDVYHNWENADD